jgi:hypothetical protein
VEGERQCIPTEHSDTGLTASSLAKAIRP